MIICSCHGISDHDLRHAHGPKGPGRTEAGTCCGNCLPLVSAITEECRSQGGEVDDGLDRRRPHQSDTASTDLTSPH